MKIISLIQSDKKQKVLDSTIVNPETGNQIKVSTALSYDTSSKVYKKAKALFDKQLYHDTKYTQDLISGKFSKFNRKKQQDYVKKLNKKSSQYIQRKELEKFNTNYTEKQSDIIDIYTSQQYKNINKYLRTNEGKKKGFDQIVQTLDKVFQKNTLEHDVSVYRGISDPSFIPKQGEIFQQQGYTSTSPNIYDAFNFARGEKAYMVKINAKKGSNAIFIGGGENELLFPRNSKYKVIKISHELGFVQIELIN